MRAPRFIPLVLSVLLLAFPARADTGGIDRTDDPSSAAFVALGEYEGELGGPDRADWYHVAVPAGTRLRIEVDMPNGPKVGLAWYQGTLKFGYPVTSPGAPIEFVRVAREFRERDLVVALESWDAQPASYVVRFIAVPTPDFALSNLVVGSAPLATPAGAVETGTQRVIDVDVANLGLAAGEADLLFAALTPEGHRSYIARVPLEIAEGASQHVRILWSPLDDGVVGDVEIRAWAWPRWDADTTNNEARTSTWTVVEGTGTGATASAAVGNCWFSVVTACAYVGVAPSWAVVGGGLRVLGAWQGGYLGVSKDEGVVFIEG